MALRMESIHVHHVESPRNTILTITDNIGSSDILASEETKFISKCAEFKDDSFAELKELCMFSKLNSDISRDAPIAYIDEELSGSEHGSLETTSNDVIADCTHKRVGVPQPESANILANANNNDEESNDCSLHSNDSGGEDTSFAKTSSGDYPVDDATYDISTVSSMESPVENPNAESLTVTEEAARRFESIESPPRGGASPAHSPLIAPETTPSLAAADGACDGLQCRSKPTRVDITLHACREHVSRVHDHAVICPEEEQGTDQCKDDALDDQKASNRLPINTTSRRPTPGEWSPVPPRHGASEENESASCRSRPKPPSNSQRQQQETICDTIKELESTLDATVYDPWKSATRHEYSPTTISFESSSRLKRLEERLNSRKQIPVIGNASTQTEDTSTKLPDIELIPPPPPPKEYAGGDNSEETFEESHVPCVITADQVLIGDVYTNCEFDAREINNYELPLDEDSHYECYDELGEEEEEEVNPDEKQGDNAECESQHQLSSVVKCKSEAGDARRGDEMVHNRDHGNLRSLLKKAGSSGSSASSVSGSSGASRNKRRVVFDEKRNEFFDADYIILIREDCAECRYDEDDEDGQCSCTCGDHEPLPQCPGCCEDHCDYDDHCSQTPQVSLPPPF